MKKIKILIISAVITLCSSTSVFAADSDAFDIDAAINAAVENTYTVKIQDIKLQQAQNNYNDTVKNLTKSVDKLTNTYDSDSRLQLMKAINDAPLESKYSVYQAANAKEVAKNQVKLSVYQEYTSLMKVKDSLDIEQTKLDNAQLELKSAQLQYDMGVVSKQSVKLKEIAYSNEKAQFNNIQRQFDLEIKKLEAIIGVSIATEYGKYAKFAKDYFIDKPNAKTYDQYVNDAWKNRAEVLNAAENLKVKNSEYDTVKAFYPSKDDNPNKDAKYNLDSAQNSLDTAKINVSIEIDSLYSDLQNKYKSLDSVQKQYNQAKKDFDQYQTKYNLGMISKLDYNAKSVAFKQAESNLKNLERDIWFAQLKLDYAYGIGTETTQSSGGQSSNGSGSQKR